MAFNGKQGVIQAPLTHNQTPRGIYTVYCRVDNNIPNVQMVVFMGVDQRNFLLPPPEVQTPCQSINWPGAALAEAPPNNPQCSACIKPTVYVAIFGICYNETRLSDLHSRLISHAKHFTPEALLLGNRIRYFFRDYLPLSHSGMLAWKRS